MLQSYAITGSKSTTSHKFVIVRWEYVPSIFQYIAIWENYFFENI